MLHAAHDLVAMVEATEAGLVRAIAARVAGRRPEIGAWHHTLAGGVAAWCGPDAPANKVAGLGFGGLPDASELADVEARFHARGAPVVVELASHADPELVAMLADRGYRLRGTEDVLGVRPGADASAVDGVELAYVSDGPARDAWFEALLDGFATPDGVGVPAAEHFPREVVAEVMRDLASVQGFECVLASFGGLVAGGGGLRVAGRVAHLCGAATRPEFRRRGVQTALVRERLRRAASLGCELVVTVTQPGSTSEANMVRQGLGLLYVRNALVLPPQARSA